MGDIKHYKNIKSAGSKLLGFSILGLFILGFIYLGWYWIAGLYSIFILIVLYQYLSGKRIIEVVLTSERITFVYTEKFKKYEDDFLLNTVSVMKDRDGSFKFSEVYNLKIYLNSEFRFLLLNQTEFSDDDLSEIYEMINK